MNKTTLRTTRVFANSSEDLQLEAMAPINVQVDVVEKISIQSANHSCGCWCSVMLMPVSVAVKHNGDSIVLDLQNLLAEPYNRV